MTVTSYSTAPSVSTPAPLPYRRWQRVRVRADVKVFGGDYGVVIGTYPDGVVVLLDPDRYTTRFQPHEIAEASA